MAHAKCDSFPVDSHLGESAAPRRLLGFFAGFGRRLTAWRADFRRARAVAEVRRAIGSDEHLLRDIGFTWNGDRIEPAIGVIESFEKLDKKKRAGG